ncbi:Ldh family oxidoreductase [bacterium]|nr:MAG: Ldh family oxidoreductase [bacterium]
MGPAPSCACAASGPIRRSYVSDPAIAIEYRLTTEAKLHAFIARSLTEVGVSEHDAQTVADVLVAADLRGIESHGSARLAKWYVGRIRQGLIDPKAVPAIVRQTATSVIVDAGNGLGHVASKYAMDAVIEKAREHGAAFGTVRNSNHFGIAGYYAMMALPHDMIGIASTNSMRWGAPTFGRDTMLGTNPLAYAVPAGEEPAFVLDFATTTVPLGRLEVFNRKALPLLPGWAVDSQGNSTTDPVAAMAGALLPLGGYGTDLGGHKGYGLGLLVDILCGVLSGGAFGNDLPRRKENARGAVAHFFGAFRIDGFRDVAAFKADMDKELRAFKQSAKAPGQDRIYVAGEIEHEKTVKHRAEGVPVHVRVWEGLEQLSRELGIPFTL